MLVAAVGALALIGLFQDSIFAAVDGSNSSYSE